MNVVRFRISLSSARAACFAFSLAAAGCVADNGFGNLLAGSPCDAFDVDSDPRCACCSKHTGTCVAEVSACAPKNASDVCGEPCPSGMVCREISGRGLCTRACEGAAQKSCGECGVQTRSCTNGGLSDWGPCANVCNADQLCIDGACVSCDGSVCEQDTADAAESGVDAGHFDASDSGDGGGVQEGGPCTMAKQCAAGLLCWEGRCISCAADATTCPSGYQCSNGECLATGYHWVAAGVGDCGGMDVSPITSGSDAPVAQNCGASTVGNTAVCWDGKTYPHFESPTPECTYKNIAAASCTGGGSPGYRYSCMAP